jgi:DNA-binding CsgD family transcriptional regulator
VIEASFLSVVNSRDPIEFEKQVVEFGVRLGFDLVSAMLVTDGRDGTSRFKNISNTPKGYAETFNDYSAGRRDPVMQHCRRRSVPIVWDQATYVAAGQGDKWDHQAKFGYRHGIALAVHLPEGHHFFLGVDRDQPIPSDVQETTRLVSRLQLFAVHAQEAAVRLLADDLPFIYRQKLTPRELDVLRWTMEGKTAWGVGEVLGISGRTVALHLIHATRKLGCANKTQAVARALRLGLLF